MAEPPSSPPNEHSTAEQSLSWYKKQYEQLCDELSEFRESSHELEAELEKDLDAADKRQRALEQKVETVQFEVDEWKVCLARKSSPSCLLPRANEPLGEMQEGQDRGERRSKYVGEGDYYSPGYEPELTTQAAGH